MASNKAIRKFFSPRNSALSVRLRRDRRYINNRLLARDGGTSEPEPVEGYLAWLYGGLEDGTDNTANELVGTVDDTLYTKNNCKEFDGVGDWLSTVIVDKDDIIRLHARIINPAGGNQVIGVQQFFGGQNHFFYFGAGSGYWLSNYGYGSSQGFSTGADSDWHDFEFSGGLFKVDGVTVVDVSGRPWLEGDFSYEFPIGGRRNGISNFNAWANWEISSFEVVGKCKYTFATGPSAIEPDVSGNGNDGAYTTTSGITTMTTQSDDAPAHNIGNGFSLLTHATLADLYWPYDVDGNPITGNYPSGYSLDSEHPAGFLHNGAESWLKTPAALDPLYDVEEEIFSTAFNISTGWTLAGWSIFYALNCSGVGAGAYASFDLSSIGKTLQEGYVYDVEFTISGYSGDGVIKAIVGGTEETGISGNGLKSFQITAGSGQDFIIIVESGTATMSIDDLSLTVIERKELPHPTLLTKAQAGDGTDAWNLSYDDNGNIVDGFYYDPALTGDDAAELLTFLEGRHS